MTDVAKILDERRKSHGDFADVAGVDQALKGVLRLGKNWDKLSASHKMALEMIAHKMARVLAGDPDEPDHFQDIAGYAALGVRDIERRTKADADRADLPRLVPRSGSADRGDSA